jgi:hypothetical protein
MSARDEKRLFNLLRALEFYQERLLVLQKQEAESTGPSMRIPLQVEIEDVRNRIDELNKQMETLSAADAAVDKVESLAVDVAGNLQSLQLLEVQGDREQIKALEEQINSLVKTSTDAIEQLKERSLSGVIEPKLSVLRPNVKLVDAHLAYRYADYQSDVNILFGFTTLFLGTGIASIIGLGIAISTRASSTVIAIHTTTAISSLLVTLLFGFLTRRAHIKANEAKEQFETDVGEREILLRSIEEDKS